MKAHISAIYRSIEFYRLILKISMIILITGSFTISCQNDSIDNSFELENDTYIFQSIEYFINPNEGDGMVVVNKYQPLKVYYNKTSSEANFTANLYEGLTEYSMFIDTDKQTYKFDIDESLKISVPSSIDNGKIVLGDKKWYYSFSAIEKISFKDYEEQKEYSVAPYTALTITCKINVEKISTSYIVILKGQNSGNIVKIKGKWEGSRIIGFNTSENLIPV